LNKKIIHMIGHSNLPISHFLALLQQHQIGSLIDVRTYPQSRWNPQFNAKALGESLGLQRVAYLHEPSLGGKNPQPAEIIRRTIETLLPFQSATCMMCSEGDFHECHRHYLLSPVMIELGFIVLQIQKDGSVIEDSGSGLL
jgi:uncharacterized protein (DUF488 family)